MNKKSSKIINKKSEAVKQQPYYDNRELSWLKFNERVLQEAGDKQVPLCERLTFLSIFSSNLDEFYMVRCGSLYDQMVYSEYSCDNKTGMTAAEQLSSIYQMTSTLCKQKCHVYLRIMEHIRDCGVELINFHDIAYTDAVYLEDYFKHSMLPLLSPQVVGKKHPFPFLKQKEIYAVALLKTRNKEKVAIVPCECNVFPRLIAVPSGEHRYVLAEELILHFMPMVFSKYNVRSKSLIRITRSADIDVDDAFYDEDLDYRDSMKKMIKERKRLRAVRMECSRMLDEKVVIHLCKQLGLCKEQIFCCETPLELSFIAQIQDDLRARKELFFPHSVPQEPRWLIFDVSMIEQIREQDRLLCYPYESMQPFLRLLQEAAQDTRVISIKMTLYRVARNSQIVESLIHAAENGKEVVVLIELRARFDEANNIEWSRRLEEAGCRLIYGIDFIKVHAKLCLITYREDNVFRHVTQIGTGNYNEKTARLYTDYCLMTASEAIASNVSGIFTKLCLGELVEDSVHMLVAPNCMRNRLLDLMNQEIEQARKGQEAYIGIKVNSLTDKVLVDKMIECSQNGVRIELVVRGICCLIPGIQGYTENITVVSIVGRYLEHARIYIFGTPDRDQIFLSSADFMTRNMTRRVEAAVPVINGELKSRIRHMFTTMWMDTVKGRELKADGRYYRREITGSELQPVNSQEIFSQEAYLSSND